METQKRKKPPNPHIEEFNVPGILWVLLLMGLMYFAPSFLSEVYVPFLPFFISLICAAFNYLFPDNPKVKELVSIITLLLSVPSAIQAEADEKPVDDEQIAKTAKGSVIGKILWG
jgi:hypothetical protein